ncbi:electron transfer flavoprotein subunit alpha [Photobacterium profundum]|uniref:Electron transfer flavoprotein subunit alpha n=1 Tax=Photobacterium profundum 3TCK TaxID=314280 RepID=Q1Z6J0_9GAMM|nr:FAD-binding protein [Photobacterium profundum]EAS44157.1 putative electron transfer flavoprotein, alpha subunit [Photobacterium profundum 3TCK]PSV59840.1 electron transfer flavoprotein subunit alpha [Photobacterium profundum]
MSEKKLATLVIAEHDNKAVSVDTLRTINAATAIVSEDKQVEITVLVIGFNCESVVESIRHISAVSNVLVVNSGVYQYLLAENISDLIAHICKEHMSNDYSHILAPATTFGKNIMPRVAALLDVGQLSDVIDIESPDVVIRPIYAGNALARVKSNDAIKVMTIRSAAFDAITISDAVISPEILNIDVKCLDINIPAESSEFISQQKVVSERPELPAASVVISGGRGLGSKESFVLVEQLADKLGGAIGASRAAVDAGFVSNDLQVGQTGKIVAPDLYIAVGISGAIQHLAGMKDSKVIVAINSDPEAPIFQIADYGLVGDLFEIMPELIRSV